MFGKKRGCDLNHVDSNQMRKINYEIEDLNTFCNKNVHHYVEVFRDTELFEECVVKS